MQTGKNLYFFISQIFVCDKVVVTHWRLVFLKELFKNNTMQTIQFLPPLVRGCSWLCSDRGTEVKYALLFLNILLSVHMDFCNFDAFGLGNKLRWKWRHWLFRDKMFHSGNATEMNEDCLAASPQDTEDARMVIIILCISQPEHPRVIGCQ